MFGSQREFRNDFHSVEQLPAQWQLQGIDIGRPPLRGSRRTGLKGLLLSSEHGAR